MKKYLAVFFQVVAVLIGLGVLAFMLWEPHLEGRNVNATNFEIYFNDPFLVFAYIASVPFFVGLYQVFRMLGYAGKGEAASPPARKALRTTRLCAIAIICFVIIAEIIIILTPSDDRVGGYVIGAIILAGSVVVAVVASKLERTLGSVLT